ncbi:hypothetical protein N7326_01980 [Corynebacterium sp. ES2794-CONJ1]|uniref:hypothetical protein n=1 Tax=unclassified Corynebacterium TaxID=2624378 RepID=UPI0021682ED2|nr:MULTISPECIES: hypothetical protein [unclassified Corynebacterium]MCS4489032.1 hypothetical protein [Corynebacterium sp. ES2775-CONJ]MCS4490845.1 hypothetical protein [Corynebacterium sp. ES2715-CONJ3]MCU9518641.1 hypothetical protein [Corynebacterium sp. ES2794-CONJ1]
MAADTIRVGLAVVSLAVMGLGYSFFVADTAKEPPVIFNGDVLGPERGETRADYQQRSRMSRREHHAPAFAYISFVRPIPADLAGEIVLAVERVNAVGVGEAAVIGIPETITQPRGDHLEEQIRLKGLDPNAVTGLVVHASPTTLDQVAQASEVLAIEVLPSDARWGLFSVRPVSY